MYSNPLVRLDENKNEKNYKYERLDHIGVDAEISGIIDSLKDTGKKIHI